MDKLIAHTLKEGLIPPVVMEFPGITASGGYSSSASESSSFKYGYFDETVNSVEMVLGNGEVVRASREDHPGLFKGAASALGTSGITILVELRLLSAKQFVHTLYHHTNNVKDTIDKLKGRDYEP
jgi:FAD/FMN-containing dehydrogenase